MKSWFVACPIFLGHGFFILRHIWEALKIEQALPEAGNYA
jgi:hypothetical protein